MKPKLERGLQGFEHRGDVSVIDSLKAEAKEIMIKFEEAQRQWRKELCWV